MSKTWKIILAALGILAAAALIAGVVLGSAFRRPSPASPPVPDVQGVRLQSREYGQKDQKCGDGQSGSPVFVVHFSIHHLIIGKEARLRLR